MNFRPKLVSLYPQRFNSISNGSLTLSKGEQLKGLGKSSPILDWLFARTSEAYR